MPARGPRREARPDSGGARAARPRARKRFGQHFLHDARILERIVAAVDPRPGDRLLEIGPGRGALTVRLLEAAAAHSPAATLDVIEIDRDLAADLAARLGTTPGFALHTGDALRFDFAALAHRRGGALRIVGNLPYNISTPLLFRLLEAPQVLQDAHLMLQREVVARMAAAPDTDDYGRLTVMLAPWVSVERLFDVGPGAFQPPPRVWSAVVRLRTHPAPPFEMGPGYARVVAAAFAQRRKTLRNALRGLLTAGQIEAAGIAPGDRPETLAPRQFAALGRALDAVRPAAS